MATTLNTIANRLKANRLNMALPHAVAADHTVNRGVFKLRLPKALANWSRPGARGFRHDRHLIAPETLPIVAECNLEQP
jgi:hypothetical protein